MPTTWSYVLEKPQQLRMHEFPVPEVGPDDALLRVELAGICGTDWKTFHGKAPYALPLILGHEILGHIAESGEMFTARTGFTVGDRVTVGGSVPCWACPACYRGEYRFCPRKHGYGTSTPCTTPPHLWGAFGEYLFLTRGAILFGVAEDIPAEAAVLTQGVVSNGYRWAGELGGVSPGDSVLVQGCGAQAIGCAAVAKERGAGLVIMTGLARDAERLALAADFGVDVTIDVSQEDLATRIDELTGHDGVDVVVDVSGSAHAFSTSIEACRRGGTLVLAGLAGEGVTAPVMLDRLVWKEITLRGAFTRGGTALAAAVAAVNNRRHPFERIVSHTFPLTEAEQAIRSIGGETDGLYPTKAAIRPTTS